MKLYMLRWPNGDTSIVGAPTKDEAMLFADSEWADPFGGAEVTELKRFAMDLVPSLDEDNGMLDFGIDVYCGANAGEEWEFIPRAYPIFEKARTSDEGYEDDDETPNLEILKPAFEAEIARLKRPEDAAEEPDERSVVEAALGWAPNSGMNGVYKRLFNVPPDPPPLEPDLSISRPRHRERTR